MSGLSLPLFAVFVAVGVERFAFAQAISPAELGEARARREPWRTELAEVLACGDLLAVPSVAERFGQVEQGPASGRSSAKVADLMLLAVAADARSLPVFTASSLPL